MARTALLVKKKPDKTVTKQGDKGVKIGWTPSGTKKAKVLKSTAKTSKPKAALVVKTKAESNEKRPDNPNKPRHLVTS